MERFVIYDSGDGTYHAGEGEWTVDPGAAQVYDGQLAARRGIEHVDCWHILRERLRAVPVASARCAGRETTSA